jgi:bifunctional ADP-heptose synthase (sugar kinase/adenylyltransferase)
MKKDRIVVTSGDYDILNVEDKRFLEKCKQKGQWLIVGLNSDMATYIKNHTIFNNFEERQELLLSMKCVDEVLSFKDNDGTSCNLLKLVKLVYPNSSITFISKRDMQDQPERRIRGINFEVIN